MLAGDRGCAPPMALETDEEAMRLPPRIRISELPPLPSRATSYLLEPLVGMTLVGFLIYMLTSTTLLTVGRVPQHLAPALQAAIWTCATIAAGCVLFLLLGAPNVIRRSPSTCYPIPSEVEEKLLAGENLAGMANVRGPEGSVTLGMYCIRCLVWRPPGMKAHHCSTCQRCVTGFDHHCGVFGRCIVGGNLPCFWLLISMLPASVAIAVLSMSFATDSALTTTAAP